MVGSHARRWLVVPVLAISLWLGFGPPRSQGQPADEKLKQMEGKWKSIRWERGPCVSKISSIAELKVRKGYKFADRAGLLVLLELTMNPSTDRDLAVICPENYSPLDMGSWFTTFEWDNIGFVKDDDKANLDGDALMDSMKATQEQDNRNRQARGWPTLSLLGWAKSPFYDPQTNLLTWATRVRASDQPNTSTVNYNSRVLGREGVMSVNLIIDDQLLEQELPNYREVLKGFNYAQGKRYAEWKAGDKVAAMGLTALIAGGAVGLAAKGGWIAKFGKAIIFGIIAIGGAIAALFKKIFGIRSSSDA